MAHERWKFHHSSMIKTINNRFCRGILEEKFSRSEINQIMKREEFNVKQFRGKIGLVVSSRLGDMYTQQIESEMRSSRGPINHSESSLRSLRQRETLLEGRKKIKTDNQGGKENRNQKQKEKLKSQKEGRKRNDKEGILNDL